MTQYLLGMTDNLKMATLCLVFAVTLQVFTPRLRMTDKSLRCAAKICKIPAKPNNTYIDFMKPVVIPCIY